MPMEQASEVFWWSEKIIFLDPECDSLWYRLAHAVAHLELHIGSVMRCEWFTDTQEEAADDQADEWLSRLDDESAAAAA